MCLNKLLYFELIYVDTVIRAILKSNIKWMSGEKCVYELTTIFYRIRDPPDSNKSCCSVYSEFYHSPEQKHAHEQQNGQASTKYVANKWFQSEVQRYVIIISVLIILMVFSRDTVFQLSE